VIRDGAGRPLPLEGVTVLELGALVAAPYCGMMLADLGANVIKLEPPDGDMARRYAPFVAGESAFFMSVNRGKRSLCLDLRDEQARDAALTLARTVDIVLHNFRPGVAERLGLGYESIVAVNPSVIYCAISGFGPRGPMAERAGIDLLFQAESGMMAVTGEAARPPLKAGTNAADVYGATTACVGILAALTERSSSGRGRLVEVAVRDAFFALQACWASSFMATGNQPGRVGSASPFTAPTDVYPTKDGSIVLAVVNDKHWQIFCHALDLDSLLEDARFRDNESRVLNYEPLRASVSEVLLTRPTTQWLSVFDQARIPYGQVLDYAQLDADPQIAFNEMILTLDHPVAGPVRVPASPIWLDAEKFSARQPPPLLGAHSREVLTEIGIDAATISRLVP
jgi:CoA:oxalate CoA-transferase